MSIDDPIDDVARLLARFGHDVEGTGLAPAAVAAAEARLGVRFPEALRRFYLRFGAHAVYRPKGAYSFRLIPPDALKIEPEESAENGAWMIVFDEGGGHGSVWQAVFPSQFDSAAPEMEYWVVDSAVHAREIGTALLDITLHNLTYGFPHVVTLDTVDREALEAALVRISDRCYGDSRRIVRIDSEGAALLRTDSIPLFVDTVSRLTPAARGSARIRFESASELRHIEALEALGDLRIRCRYRSALLHARDADPNRIEEASLTELKALRDGGPDRAGG